MTIARIAAGVPSGGQFATQNRADSEVALATPNRQQSLPELTAAITADLEQGDVELAQMAAGADRSNFYQDYDECRVDALEHNDGLLRNLLGALKAADATGHGHARTDEKPGNDICDGCRRHVDACTCLDRDLNPGVTTLAEVDLLLSAAYGSQDDAVIHRLSAFAAGTRIRQSYPGAAYLDLDWEPDGLAPVTIRDRFGDDLRDQGSDDVLADVKIYTTNLRAAEKAFQEFAEPAPAGHHVPYHLHLDRSLGEDVWA